MAITSHVAALPMEQALPLVAQVGQRGNPAWIVVGKVVRRRDKLDATFMAEAGLCEPAWEACLENAHRGSFLQDHIRFGAVTAVGVVLIAEGEVSNLVVRQSQVIARRFAEVTDTERQEQARRGQEWRRFIRGSGPARLRSTWPRG